MQIDWWTLALQAINFVVLVWLLSRFLYRPVQAIIEKRKQLMDKGLSEVEELKADAKTAQKRFEDERSALASEREGMLKDLHQKMGKEHEEALKKAKDEAAQMLENARATIQAEREAALKALREQASTLATELASTLLRELGQGVPNESFLGGLKKYISDLPEEEHDRLRKDLADEGSRLKVVTAFPLSPEESSRWAEVIAAIIGGDGKMDFAVDGDLLGGAELHFPHAVLRYSWADQLKKAKVQLDSDEAAA